MEQDSLSVTSATIDLTALQHNARQLQAAVEPARLLAVIKADAYGHGALASARALRAAGVQHFAVATLPEALALRQDGLTEPVLVFAAPLPEHLPFYAAHDLDVTISSAAVAEAAIALQRPLRAHLKVDTGMGRIGVPPDEAPDVVGRLAAAPQITLAGLWTHLATASEPDSAFVDVQLGRFRQVMDALRQTFPNLPAGTIHIGASDVVGEVPDAYRLSEPTLVRAGLSLYGLANQPDRAERLDLRPVLRWTSRVTHLKTVDAGTTISYGQTWTAPRRTRIATVGAGYADGYRRLLSNRAAVGIGGRRYPVAGVICMDMFMIDLGDPDGPGQRIAVGDEVVLLGKGGPSADELAAWAETISYEICCGVGRRVPRRYVGAAPPVGTIPPD